MSKQTRLDKVKLLGVEVDAFSIDSAVKYICDLAQQKRGAAYVVKPYVEFLDRADHDAEIRRLLNDADLSLADGVALLWAAHYLFAGPRTFLRFWTTLCQIPLAPGALRWPLPDRMSGTNFTWPLLEAAGSRRLRLLLIGKPSQMEIDAVGRIIINRAPGLTIAGTLPGFDAQARAGQVTEGWLAETTGKVRSADPDLVLVGMGFPLQEKVCAYLAQRLPRGVFIGEGGTFDYESFGGTRRKAPGWIQRTGTEWLWRLAIEPSRLRRQMAVPRFMMRIWQTRKQ
jgi:N-acetylglucosaminyldiphosphoundecaprenol N-acetyl-beta-D-mannosaminyltransferase